MRNIFLLSTDQPSRLYLDGNKLELDIESYGINGQYIYVTSDEKIKEGDWCMSLCDDESYEEIYQCNNIGLVDDEDKKIILTTDPNLIADDVQAIDDIFLEWFINNQSCDFVGIECWETKGEWNLEYKIIIPKEESKNLDNPTTNIIREAMKIVSKDVRPPKLSSNNNLVEISKKTDEEHVIYNIEPVLNYQTANTAEGHHSIVIGNGLTSTKPYQLLVDRNGIKIDKIMTIEEHDLLYKVLKAINDFKI
jgi:hypothetical protein